MFGLVQKRTRRWIISYLVPRHIIQTRVNSWLIKSPRRMTIRLKFIGFIVMQGNPCVDNYGNCCPSVVCLMAWAHTHFMWQDKIRYMRHSASMSFNYSWGKCRLYLLSKGTIVYHCIFPIYLWREYIYDRHTSQFTKVGSQLVKTLLGGDLFPSYFFKFFRKKIITYSCLSSTIHKPSKTWRNQYRKDINWLSLSVIGTFPTNITMFWCRPCQTRHTIGNYTNPGYGLSLVDTLTNAGSYRQPLEQEGNPMT